MEHIVKGYNLEQRPEYFDARLTGKKGNIAV
jgi:hypothetical protein